MAIRLFVFDAYGTLFDVGAAVRQAAAEPGAEAWAARWVALAAQWRRKQLEYSWIRAVAGAHADFWQVTQDALDWTLEAEGLADPQLRQRLLDLYYELPAFPEVPEMLRQMKELGFTLAILSNGSPPMLQAAVDSAGDRTPAGCGPVDRGGGDFQARSRSLRNGGCVLRRGAPRDGLRVVEQLGRLLRGGLRLPRDLDEPRGCPHGPPAGSTCPRVVRSARAAHSGCREGRRQRSEPIGSSGLDAI